jgi:hypothetical protein
MGTTNKMMKLPLTEMLNMDWSTPVTTNKNNTRTITINKHKLNNNILKKRLRNG